jgi:hypothetical protein
LIVIWALVPSGMLIWPWVRFWLPENPAIISATSWAAAVPMTIELTFTTAFVAAALVLAGLGLLRLGFKTLLVTVPVLLVCLATAIYQPLVSAAPAIGFAVLLALVLCMAGMQTLPRPGYLILSSLLLLTLATQAGFQAFSQQNFIGFGPERQMPALVVAQSEVGGSSVITLLIEADSEGADSQLVWGDGLGLEERSLATRYLSPEFDRGPIRELTALLLAGNPSRVGELLEQSGIGFILLRSKDAALLSSIEVGISSMEFLQPAGQSEFGLLWRTGIDAPNLAKPIDPWRNYQIWTLAGFLLLALPTPAAIRGSRRAFRGER